MPSALGKRTRCLTSQSKSTRDRMQHAMLIIATDSSPRSKRVAIESSIVIHVDETESLKVPITKSAGTTPATPKSTTRPSKHGTPKLSVDVSPTSISSHFTVCKPTPVTNIGKDLSVDATIPKTPRHRDSVAQKVLVTPSHRLSSPRSGRTPRTPRTSLLGRTPIDRTENVYTRARQVFATRSDTSNLIGREQEQQALRVYAHARLAAKAGGCLYISGPPGTGKSAFVTKILDDVKAGSPFSSVTINCMGIKSVKDLVTRMYEGLLPDHSKDTSLSSIDHLKTQLTKATDEVRPYVVVLDEIDQLMDIETKALYDLFDWAMQPESNMSLIGIANALDLTDRLLPRLKSRNIKPELLPFMPYTAEQIETILKAKLVTFVPDTAIPDYIPIIHPAAITLCAKKIAAHSGDLRKAFDICTQAIDLTEQQTRAQQAQLTLQDDSPTKASPLCENINLSSPPVEQARPKPRQLRLSSNLEHLTWETAPRVTIAHMAKITSAIFSNGLTQRLQALTMQQKAIMCTLAGLEEQQRNIAAAARFSTPSKKTTATAPTVRRLYDAYTAICKRDSLLSALSSIEFKDVLGGLETQSLISVVADNGRATGSPFAMPATPSRTPSRRGKSAFGNSISGTAGTSGMLNDKRLSCCVGQKELLESLQGPGSDLLKAMLEEGSVDLL